MEIQKKKNGGWGRVGRGQGGCERRSEAFVKIQKKNIGGGGSGRGGGRVWGGQGGCERRSEAFVDIEKNWGGGRVRGGGGQVAGVRLDVNGEVKFL